MTQQLEAIIERGWEARSSLSPISPSDEIRNAVNAVIDALDREN